LISTINGALGDSKLNESELSEAFEVWWPKLEVRLNEIPQPQALIKPARNERDILEEILRLVRSLTTSTQASVTEARTTTFDFLPEIIEGREFSDAAIAFLSGYLGKSLAQIRKSRFKRETISDALDALIGANAPILKTPDKTSVESTSSMESK